MRHDLPTQRGTRVQCAERRQVVAQLAGQWRSRAEEERRRREELEEKDRMRALMVLLFEQFIAEICADFCSQT